MPVSNEALIRDTETLVRRKIALSAGKIPRDIRSKAAAAYQRLSVGVLTRRSHSLYFTFDPLYSDELGSSVPLLTVQSLDLSRSLDDSCLIPSGSTTCRSPLPQPTALFEQQLKARRVRYSYIPGRMTFLVALTCGR